MHGGNEAQMNVSNATNQQLDSTGPKAIKGFSEISQQEPEPPRPSAATRLQVSSIANQILPFQSADRLNPGLTFFY